jgi:hypothetical protein
MAVPANPRSVITQEAFSVAPELLGLPLARPWRRLVAMLADLALVGFLVHAGGGVVFGLAVALVFFRAAARFTGPARGPLGRIARASLRATAAIVLFAVVANVSGQMMRGSDAPATRASLAPAAEGARWRPAADETLQRQEDSSGAPSLHESYDAAVAAGDSQAALAIGRDLGAELARDSIAALGTTITGLREERTELHRMLDEERERGLLTLLLRVLDEIGIGFGWTGLYFTAFVSFWNGRTPGKRLMGIRVLRLNGKPMSLWMAFERFGGYAASLFTGLLGFVQILWDRNRQGIHDKIVETVVIQETAGARLPA